MTSLKYNGLQMQPALCQPCLEHTLRCTRALFDLMVLVVTNVFPSINAGYKARKADVGVSIDAVYDKLNGLDAGVSAALVKDTAAGALPGKSLVV
jgi:hypothetical protein